MLSNITILIAEVVFEFVLFPGHCCERALFPLSICYIHLAMYVAVLGRNWTLSIAYSDCTATFEVLWHRTICAV